MELRIALCQTDIAWEQPVRNLARLEPLVAGADADVVVLPELFATGFTLDPAAVAETPGGAVVTALRRWAVQYGKAVAGSVAIAEAGRFFNRMYFVTPDGGCVFYDKHHLFTPGGEARNYTPVAAATVVEIPGASAFCCSSATICGFRSGAAAAGLRRHPVLRLVARVASRGVADAAACPGHREPMLCRGGESGGGRPFGALCRGFGSRRFQGLHAG